MPVPYPYHGKKLEMFLFLRLLSFQIDQPHTYPSWNDPSVSETPPYNNYGCDYSSNNSMMSMMGGKMGMMSSSMGGRMMGHSSSMRMKSGSGKMMSGVGVYSYPDNDDNYEEHRYPPSDDGTCCMQWMVQCHPGRPSLTKSGKRGSGKMNMGRGHEEICEPYCAVPCEDDDYLPTTCSRVSTTNNLGCPCQCTCCAEHNPVCECQCESCIPAHSTPPNYSPPPPYYTEPQHPYPPKSKSKKDDGYYKGSKEDGSSYPPKSKSKKDDGYYSQKDGNKKDKSTGSKKKESHDRYPVYGTDKKSRKSSKEDKGKGYPLSFGHA